MKLCAGSRRVSHSLLGQPQSCKCHHFPLCILLLSSEAARKCFLTLSSTLDSRKTHVDISSVCDFSGLLLFSWLDNYFRSWEITKEHEPCYAAVKRVLEKRASKLQVKFQTIDGNWSVKLKMPNLKLLVGLSCCSQGNCEKKIRETLGCNLLYFESLSHLTYLEWWLFLILFP